MKSKIFEGFYEDAKKGILFIYFTSWHQESSISPYWLSWGYYSEELWAAKVRRNPFVYDRLVQYVRYNFWSNSYEK